MIEVEIPKDIRQYESKVVGPLTVRNLVCLVCGSVIAVPVYMIIKDLVPTDLCIFVSLLCFAPFALCGWIKIYGMPFEQFFMSFLYSSVLAPSNRKYKTKNIFEEDLEKEHITKKRKYKPSKNPDLMGFK